MWGKKIDDERMDRGDTCQYSCTGWRIVKNYGSRKNLV